MYSDTSAVNPGKLIGLSSCKRCTCHGGCRTVLAWLSTVLCHNRHGSVLLSTLCLKNEVCTHSPRCIPSHTLVNTRLSRYQISQSNLECRCSCTRYDTADYTRLAAPARVRRPD